MEIAVATKGSMCRAQITGEVSIYHAVEFKERVLALLETCGELELNLAGVTELDTAGLQILLLAKREAERAGKGLHLIAHSDAAREVIELYNLAARFGDPLILPAERN